MTLNLKSHVELKPDSVKPRASKIYEKAELPPRGS